jgi:putative transposase
VAPRSSGPPSRESLSPETPRSSAYAGIDPAPQRSSSTWADFLWSQADALLACDFFETLTLTGTRIHVFAVIEHASRRIRVLGATAHPSAAWVTRIVRNLIMERWVQIWNQPHLLHALREFETHDNDHRPHQGIDNARPRRRLPDPITYAGQITRLDIRRRDRLGGILHEYENAA